MKVCRKWFYQNYVFEGQPRYSVVVAEDGGKSYDRFGARRAEYEYEYLLLNGDKQKVGIEKLD